MSLPTFLDGLVAVCGQDLAWIIAFTIAGGILLAAYLPIAMFVRWLMNRSFKKEET